MQKIIRHIPFILVFVTCLAGQVSGQIQPGIRLAFGISDIIGPDLPNRDRVQYPSPSVGFYLRFNMNDNLFFQPEVLGTLKGIKYNTQTFLGPPGTFTTTEEYLFMYTEMPATLNYRIWEIGIITFGGYASYLLSANYNRTEDKFINNEIIKESYSSSSMEGYNKLDYGVTAGLGVDIPDLGLNAGLRMNKGFGSLFEASTENSYTNVVYQLTLGYTF